MYDLMTTFKMFYHCKPQRGTVDLGVEMATFPMHILLHSPCLLFVHFLSYFCQINFAKISIESISLKQKSSHTHNGHVLVPQKLYIQDCCSFEDPCCCEDSR